MIPMLGEVVGIVCNKAMMKEAGLLDENGEIINAETWDDLSEYASKLTKDGQTGLGIDWGSNMMLYTYEACLNGVAGTIFKEDGTTIEYTGDNVKYLLESWKKLIDDGYTTTDVFADMDANRTQFKSGQLAMHLAPASRWIEAGEVHPRHGNPESFRESGTGRSVYQRRNLKRQFPAGRNQYLRQDVSVKSSL